MTTADVLDGGFRLVRAAPVAVLVPALVVAVVSTLAQVGLRLAIEPSAPQGIDLGNSDTPGLGDTVLRQLCAQAVGAIATAVVTAFVAGVALNAVSGRPLSLAAVWPVVRRRLAAVIALSLVVAVVETVALAACVAPGVWLWGLWALTVPAVVFERAGVGNALGRSRALVRGSFWRVFGLRLLAFLVTVAIGYLFGVPFGLVAGQVSSEPAAVALVGLGTLLTAAVVLPLRGAVDVMLYLDQRVRTEAFDVVVSLQRTGV